MNIPSEALELAAWEVIKGQEFGSTLYKRRCTRWCTHVHKKDSHGMALRERA